MTRLKLTRILVVVRSKNAPYHSISGTSFLWAFGYLDKMADRKGKRVPHARYYSR